MPPRLFRRQAMARGIIWTFLILLTLRQYECEARSCSLVMTPSVVAIFNETSGKYVISNGTRPPQGGRMLRIAKNRQVDEAITLKGFSIRMQKEEQDKRDPPEQVMVRQCWCSYRDEPRSYNETPLYCPIEFDGCEAPDNGDPEMCYIQDRNTTMAQFFWFMALFFYGSFGLMFLGSEQGASARSFIYRKLCLSHEHDRQAALERSADTLLAIHPQRAFWLTQNVRRRERLRRRRQMLRHYRRQGHRGDMPEAAIPPMPFEFPPPPTRYPSTSGAPNALALKTRIFVSPSSADSARTTKQSDQVSTTKLQLKQSRHGVNSDIDPDLGPTCSICLGQVNSGDRVGVLPCDHVFHVECLKPWLKRRNVCPLCQAQNVATPRFCSVAEQAPHNDANGAAETSQQQ